MDGTDKQKFRNMTGGYIGVVIQNDAGKMSGISLGPGEGVELSEREQRATANAPRLEKDNPFVGGFEDPETGEKGPALVAVDSDEDVQRPIGVKPESPPVEEQAADVPAPADEPETGTRPDDEEVATPEAPKQRAAARAKDKPKRPAVTA